jgi:hypothetical protein
MSITMMIVVAIWQVTRVLDSPPPTVTAEQLVNSKDGDGRLALGTASDEGHRDLVVLLLDRGAGEDDDDDEEEEEEGDEDDNDDDDGFAAAQISRPRTKTASRPSRGRR